MTTRKSGLRWLYFISVNLAIAAVLLAAYFFLYLNAKHSYYIQREFRALDEISRQLDTRLLHLRNVLDFWPEIDPELSPEADDSTTLADCGVQLGEATPTTAVNNDELRRGS